jgi:hypothetical protein
LGEPFGLWNAGQFWWALTPWTRGGGYKENNIPPNLLVELECNVEDVNMSEAQLFFDDSSCWEEGYFIGWWLRHHRGTTLFESLDRRWSR